MTQCIGIDLGTAYLKAAYVGKDGFFASLKDKNGDLLIPSVVAISSGGFVVGGEAKERLKSAPESVIESPLKHLSNTGWHFSYDGEEYPASVIVAIMLKYLKQEIEAILGDEVREAVIAIPSYFGDTQRVLVKQAATIAGLDVLRVTNETTAVLYAYVQAEGAEDGKIVCCNLGYGPFEVSVTEVDDKEIKVRCTSDTGQIDGERCLTLLADYLEAKFREGNSVDFVNTEKERAEICAASDRVFRALSDDYATDVELSKTLPSGFSKDISGLEGCIAHIRNAGVDITTIVPFDYYDFCGITRDSSLDHIGETLSSLRIEKMKAAQDSSTNMEKYRAADDLIIIAKAHRVFASEATKLEYDVDLERYEKSFLALACSETTRDENIAAHQFSEREKLQIITRNASDLIIRANTMLRIMNSTPKNILEYYSALTVDMKINLDRDILSRLLQTITFAFYECIKNTVNRYGWEIHEIKKIVFAGGFSQSRILSGSLTAHIQNAGANEITTQSVPIDYAARGALLIAQTLTNSKNKQK